MRKPAFVLALFLALAAGSFPATAHADPPPHHPWGFLCGFTASNDPQVEGSATGELGAGPVFLGTGVSGRVVCTIQVNASTHSGWPAVQVTGEGASVVIAEGTATFATTTGDNVYVCTRVEYDDGTTLYYNDPNDLLWRGSWVPWSHASCGLASSVNTPGGDEYPPYEVRSVVWFANEVICPVLAILFPPYGDVPGLWDCWPDDWYWGDGWMFPFRDRRFVEPPPEVLDPGPIDPGPIPGVPVACSDGTDNDGDGRTDYPNDPDCTDANDTSEAPQPPCPNAGGVTYCASLTSTGVVYQEFAVAPTSSTAVQAAGYVDAYEFTLPNGGVVTLPCVVVIGGGTPADACGLAGGRYASRIASLVDTPVPLPGTTPGPPLATVRVCHADLVLTVNSLGLTTFPAYTVC